MLISCSYCGKLHKRGTKCPDKPATQTITKADRFRWTAQWQKKRKQINMRDKYLCQVCIREIHGTDRKYNYNDLSVHHIVPINSNWNLRLDDSNLICLCSVHHDMADKNQIDRKELEDIVGEQMMGE